MRTRHPATDTVICDYCKTMKRSYAGEAFLPYGWFHLEYTSEPSSTGGGVKSLHFDSLPCMTHYMACVQDYRVNEKTQKGVQCGDGTKAG